MSLKRIGVARDIKGRTSGDTEENDDECGVAMMQKGPWPDSLSDVCSIPFPSKQYETFSWCFSRAYRVLYKINRGHPISWPE